MFVTGKVQVGHMTAAAELTMLFVLEKYKVADLLKYTTVCAHSVAIGSNRCQAFIFPPI